MAVPGMQSRRWARALLAALVGPAASHESGRRAQTWDSTAGAIWGSCGDNLTDDVDVTSCPLVDGATCWDHLSDGPPDAGIEVVLGNLPASTSEDPVHLQWWAGFKSEHEYQPLVSAHGAAIYNDMHIAYPKYWEPGFNGGNVRVNESGIAVVRFAAPSTYYVKPYLAWPHVHFRVCKGGAGAAFYYDSLVFAKSVFMVSRSQGSPIVILSLSRYDSDHGVQNYSIPESIGYLSIPSTSTATTLTISTTSVSSVVDFSSDAYSLTATTTATISRPATGSLPEILMSAEMEALTLDALEFSPVYDCLVDGTVFDHFSGSCADACPGDAELQYGQCVLPEIEASSRVTLTASWHLEVHCEELCGLGMENETLHNVRLGVASHLDIPFQEVTRTALTWLDAESRRLSAGARNAVLSVQVETRRHDEVSGLGSLRTFVAGSSDIGRLLGMSVDKVYVLPEDATIIGGPSWTITNDSDPYAWAYSLLLGEQVEGGSHEKAAGSILPVGGVVVFVVSVVACLSLACGGLLWVSRRRSRWALSGSNAEDIQEVAGTTVPKGKKICVEFDAQDDDTVRQDNVVRHGEQNNANPQEAVGRRDEQDYDIEI
mmetsp:Transcript_82553/g.230843  ORF Transcript_82553/g.230843 Transcript_82553/m.230843 type:complete len:601 (-) Transcript_82553:451-2253(-)